MRAGYWIRVRLDLKLYIKSKKCVHRSLIKKENQMFLIYMEFRRDRLQIHIWLTASSYIGKYLQISSYIRKLFFIYDVATYPILISLYMRKISFSFYKCWSIFEDKIAGSGSESRSCCMLTDQKCSPAARFSRLIMIWSKHIIVFWGKNKR